MSDPRHGSRARIAVRVLHATLLLAFVGLLLAAGLWRLQGGRLERVQTPSMGTAAPVGSLLWVQPVDFESLRPGDFISFRPPGRDGTTYSHRVLDRAADGTIGTQGEITAPDPWRLGPHDVLGKVAMTWVGVGWLVQAAPVLVGGALVIGLVRSRLRRDLRLPATLVLTSVVLAGALSIYRPLLGAQKLAVQPLDGGAARVSFVGTGLLPVAVSTPDSRIVVAPGHVGAVTVHQTDATGGHPVRLSPAFSGWWLLLVTVGCFAPALREAARNRWRRRSVEGRRTPRLPGGLHTAPR